jgi:hypothetical protein
MSLLDRIAFDDDDFDNCEGWASSTGHAETVSRTDGTSYTHSTSYSWGVSEVTSRAFRRRGSLPPATAQRLKHLIKELEEELPPIRANGVLGIEDFKAIRQKLIKTIDRALALTK